MKAVKLIAEEPLLQRRLHVDHDGLLLELAFGEITEQEYLQQRSLIETIFCYF